MFNPKSNSLFSALLFIYETLPCILKRETFAITNIKMKTLFTIIFLIGLVTFSNAQSITFNDFKFRESLPDWVIFKTEQIRTERPVYIDGTLNPFYLETDFDGDSVLDIALFVKEKTTNKKGILIIHGQSFKTHLIGAGENFAHVGDDFRFLEVWKIYREKEVELTVFSDDGDIAGNKMKEINLPAISVASSEGTSNIIIWENNKYIWLHTGD